MLSNQFKNTLIYSKLLYLETCSIASNVIITVISANRSNQLIRTRAGPITWIIRTLLYMLRTALCSRLQGKTQTKIYQMFDKFAKPVSNSIFVSENYDTKIYKEIQRLSIFIIPHGNKDMLLSDRQDS